MAAPEATVPQSVLDAAGQGPRSCRLRPLLFTSPSRVGCRAGAPGMPGQWMHLAFPAQGRACAQKQLYFLDQLLDVIRSLTIGCSR